MKKFYLFFATMGMLASFTSYSQQSYFKAPTGTSTTNLQAPNGSSAHAYVRGCFIIPSYELSSIATVTALNAVGFNLVNGTGTTPVTGTIQIYLQNTSDPIYQKGTIWSNVITSMTSVYNSTMMIPQTPGATTINLALPSNFTYTGGGLYVAYDWYSAGPYETSTVANYEAQPNLIQGGATSSSALSAPANVVQTNVRPNFNFGYINTFTNELSVEDIVSHGKIPIVPSSPYSFSVVVKNYASITATNATINLSMSGANTFTTTTTIPSIASGATVMANFPAFTPTSQGSSTINVTVPPDQNNFNNSGVTNQSVTCEVLALGQPSSATNSYSLGVGYAAGGNSILMRFTPAVNSTVVAVNIAIASDPSNIGKPVFALLANNFGGLLAMSNTIVLTAAHLNKFVTFFFPNPILVTGGTAYHAGMSQPTAPHFPYGVLPANYIPNNYFYQSGLYAGFLISFNQNYGMFGVEPIFSNGITLTVNSPTICSGNTVTLTANSSSANYSWTPTASTSNSIVVTPSVSTMYVVSTNSSGLCYAQIPSFVTVNTTPTITVPDGGICPTPGSYTFAPSGASTYTFSGGNPVSPTITTQYTVVGTSTAGCVSNSVTPTVYVANSSFTVSILSPTAICLGKTGTLTGVGAASYSWSTSQTVNPIFVSPSVPNTYGVLGTIGTCTSYATTLLLVNQNPTVNVSASNAYYCVGSPPTTITASGANTYSWNSGQTTASIAVSPTSIVTYSVAGYDLNGCVASTLMTIGVANNPTVNASTNSPTICIHQSATLTASGALGYTWANATSSTNVAVVTPTATTIYTVTGSDINGCTNTYTLTQFVDACAGIKVNNLASVKTVIYPNPNNGAFNLSISTLTENTSIELYNAIGQLLFTQSIKTNLSMINVSDLSNGVYVAKIKEGNETIETMRVIKQ